jgi:hypothetical protein
MRDGTLVLRAAKPNSNKCHRPPCSSVAQNCRPIPRIVAGPGPGPRPFERIWPDRVIHHARRQIGRGLQRTQPIQRASIVATQVLPVMPAKNVSVRAAKDDEAQLIAETTPRPAGLAQSNYRQSMMVLSARKSPLSRKRRSCTFFKVFLYDSTADLQKGIRFLTPKDHPQELAIS